MASISSMTKMADTSSGMEITIEDSGGQTSVLLSEDGDHIVVRYLIDNAGFEREITLPHDSFAWDRAVRRAEHGVAFL